LTQRNLRRRSLLGAVFALPAIVPLASCTDMAMFGQKPKYTLTPRGDRMVRWLQNEGREVMMAPDALALAMPVKASAKSAKSCSETALPRAFTRIGIETLACSSTSGSTPPVAATGLVTPLRPRGRSRAWSGDCLRSAQGR